MDKLDSLQHKEEHPFQGSENIVHQFMDYFEHTWWVLPIILRALCFTIHISINFLDICHDHIFLPVLFEHVPVPRTKCTCNSLKLSCHPCHNSIIAGLVPVWDGGHEVLLCSHPLFGITIATSTALRPSPTTAQKVTLLSLCRGTMILTKSK